MGGVLSSVNSEVQAGKSLVKETKNFLNNPKLKEFMHNHWIGCLSIIFFLFLFFVELPNIINDSHQPIIDTIAELQSRSDTIDGLMVRTQLLQMYSDYMERGYCPAAEKEFYADFYEQYKVLGFNHIQEYHLDQIMKLPEVKPE